jgi:predicted transcriptional regulator
MKNTQYITIQGWMVNELKLKGNDLIVYAVIYGFSQDGESKFSGSIDYLCKTINGTRPTVRKAIKNLLNRNLIIKETIKKTFNVYQTNLEVVKKLSFGGKETLPGDSKETIPNTNTINTIEDRKKKFQLLLKPYIEKYGNKMMNQFYSYWTELNKSKKKMRFEEQRFFEIGKRLSTWNSRNNKGGDEDTGTFNAADYQH